MILEKYIDDINTIIISNIEKDEKLKQISDIIKELQLNQLKYNLNVYDLNTSKDIIKEKLELKCINNIIDIILIDNNDHIGLIKNSIKSYHYNSLKSNLLGYINLIWFKWRGI